MFAARAFRASQLPRLPCPRRPPSVQLGACYNTTNNPNPALSDATQSSSKSHSSSTRSNTSALLARVGAVAVLCAAAYKTYDVLHSGPTPAPALVDTRPANVPRFRLSEVHEHDAKSQNPWVTYQDRVYDITDWVGAHPGGDVILRAAGGPIEPYWKIFAVHNTSYAKEVMSQFLIGYVHIEDLGPNGKPIASEVEDPFVDDPARDPRLQTITAKPRSAETPQDDLSDHFLTPTRTFFVRNHMWVPSADVDKHTLTVELADGTEKVYTLAELKKKFPRHHITAALQCAGNRRSHMTAVKATNGLQWGVGAISNAEWEGVKLSDVLADAAGAVPSVHSGAWNQASLFGDSARHVWFSGLEAYGASIPLSTAFDPRSDVLLAFGMNGEPLPADHGSPIRALVPGHVAARSVKFLNRITVSEEESPTQWQRKDYKCFGPNQTATELDWDTAPAIQEMPVTSAITRVTVDSSRIWKVKGKTGGTMVKMVNRQHQNSQDAKEKVTTRRPDSEAPLQKPETIATHVVKNKQQGSSTALTLRGYAYSGGGREIVRVDVSLDGGQTWTQARLLDNCNKRHTMAKAAGEEQLCGGNKYWAWKRWECEADLGSMGVETSGGDSPGCIALVCKATDEAYNTQPQEAAAIYNARGNLSCAWHRLTLCPDADIEELTKKP